MCQRRVETSSQEQEAAVLATLLIHDSSIKIRMSFECGRHHHDALAFCLSTVQPHTYTAVIGHAHVTPAQQTQAPIHTKS
jgi:hypothetical protein